MIRTYRAEMIRVTRNDLVPSRPYILLCHDADDDGAVIRLSDRQARLIVAQLRDYLEDEAAT